MARLSLSLASLGLSEHLLQATVRVVQARFTLWIKSGRDTATLRHDQGHRGDSTRLDKFTSPFRQTNGEAFRSNDSGAYAKHA